MGKLLTCVSRRLNKLLHLYYQSLLASLLQALQFQPCIDSYLETRLQSRNIELLPTTSASELVVRKFTADLPSFSNPSIITGDDYRPDLLILTKDNCLVMYSN